MEFRIFKLDEKTWRIEEFDKASSVYFYLLAGEREALLLDTGMGVIDTAGIVGWLTSLPVKVLCTHAHFDHVGGAFRFRDVWMHRADQALYGLYVRKEMRDGAQASLPAKADIHWFDGEPVWELGGRTLEVIHTPGHSPGSVCLLDVERRWLFTGDTCCKADVLLNLPYGTSVERYGQSMKKLLARKNTYDLTWPDHHTVPVKLEVLEQFSQAAGLLCDGKAEGTDFSFVFGTAKRFACQEIAIVYSPGRIRE